MQKSLYFLLFRATLLFVFCIDSRIDECYDARTTKKNSAYLLIPLKPMKIRWMQSPSSPPHPTHPDSQPVEYQKPSFIQSSLAFCINHIKRVFILGSHSRWFLVVQVKRKFSFMSVTNSCAKHMVKVRTYLGPSFNPRYNLQRFLVCFITSCTESGDQYSTNIHLYPADQFIATLVINAFIFYFISIFILLYFSTLAIELLWAVYLSSLHIGLLTCWQNIFGNEWKGKFLSLKMAWDLYFPDENRLL